MTKRLLGYDPITGLYTYHDYDPQTDQTIIQHEGDCEPVLERNVALANDTEYTKTGIKRELWHYASIPAALQVKWLIEEGIDVYKEEDWPRVSKKLEDLDFRKLKTTSKKHL